MSLPVAVFASGGGTNLQALMDHEAVSGAYRVELVVSDKAEAGALDRARREGRRAEVIPVSGRPEAEVARETLDVLDDAGIEAILLAGYLRLVPADVVSDYRRRIVNVHPALLPSFGGKGMYGLRVHEAVLQAGCKVTGVTIHYVDESYDTGTILAQWPVPVRSGDTPERLASRVLEVEHLLYPLTADHLCRALARDREPAPFDPPGSAFESVEGPADGGVARRIRQAFENAPEETGEP